VNILRTRSCGKLDAGSLCLLQQLQTLSDNGISRVQLSCTGVRVDSIRDLVVATLVKAAKVKPYLRYVRIDADSTRVCIKSVTVLIDLKIENADRAPEGRITTITVNRLLISLVCFVVLLTGHVCPSEEVPTLSVMRVSFQTSCQICDGGFLVLK
jgi:hypothetical protein